MFSSVKEEIRYICNFIDTYFAHSGEPKGMRELACLRLQFPQGIGAVYPGDLFAGRLSMPPVGFSPQEAGDMGYFLNHDRVRELLDDDGASADEKARLFAAYQRFLPETTIRKLEAAYPPHFRQVLPTMQFESVSGIAFDLCRMSGTQPDFGKLCRLGIDGLRREVAAHDDGTPFYAAMRGALDLFSDVCRALAAETDGETADTLLQIADHKPQTLRQGIQLVLLYLTMSGSLNFGRMDTYLGPLLKADLDSGRLDEEAALTLIKGFWSLISARNSVYDLRVIIGGRGREDEAACDAFAKLAIRASMEQNDVLPQLTLRFYRGQDPSLYTLALDSLASGCVYPMLYNDDVNIPAVMHAFGVAQQEAQDYTPFGCGEYVLYHRSVGTPSGVINLGNALLATLFGGINPLNGSQMGENFGTLCDYETFDDLWDAYTRQVRRHIEVLAEQERLEYDVAGQTADYLLLSLLHDDCTARGKGMFDGGVRYLGGTVESYGDTNTADSLTALRQVVFEQKLISKERLLEALRADFAGFETERALLLRAPKYGNDDPYADEMRKAVHEYTCLTAKEQAARVGLHSYLVVVINNGANATFGNNTAALPDGRRAHEPFANANNPQGGADREGPTAMLRSLLTLPADYHAGTVQNLKLSKELMNEGRDKAQALLDGYWRGGGTQLMITCLNPGDLEAALQQPEKYRNLIVRVGGFSARFVELDPQIQKEILSRTLHSM